MAKMEMQIEKKALEIERADHLEIEEIEQTVLKMMMMRAERQIEVCFFYLLCESCVIVFFGMVGIFSR